MTRHLTNLITFDFKFDLHQYEYNNIPPNTFRSSFWLNIKRWIVVLDPVDSSFKTIPRFARKSIHFSNDYPQSTTTDDSLPSFDHYMYIREITLSSFINNDWIERLGSIVIFNQIEELNIGRNQLLEILIKVKPVMPQLKRLIVSCLSLNTLGKNNLKDCSFEQIRSLRFYDTDCTVNKADNLCYLFPNLEHLQIYLKHRLEIIPYLERYMHLCTFVCELKTVSSSQHNRKHATRDIRHEWFVKNVPRWRIINNFTCQITQAHVYLWINNKHKK